MKKHLHNSLRALFLALAVLLSLPMLAERVEIDGINYDLVAKVKQAAVIAKSSGKYSGEVVIPESVVYEGTAYSVTSIGYRAFYNCTALTSVIIGNSVTSIGEYAFYKCSGLTSVTIGNSVTSIGEYAFYKCYYLTSVTIGNSVTSIGNYAFYDCYKLTSVTIGNSVTSIGDYAFYESGLTSVTIPNSVTSIGAGAFYLCEGLTSVTIGNGVKSIGEYAFFKCSGLTSVHISDIAAWCNIDFAYNYSNPLVHAHHLYLNGEEVKDLVIPNSVTSIGGHAFRACSGLTSVTIGNSVKSIGVSAFYDCSGLTSVTIGNSVTSIGDYAFRGCSGLTSVTIGNGVKSIGEEAFGYCSGLTSVTIPNSVTSIGSSAFRACSGLTSVTIGKSVTSIGWGAFRDCFRLTSVTIPNSVTSIGDGAFSRCSGLTSVTIGNSVKSIGSNAFYKCSGLTSVTIPNSVESIGNYAFSYCTGLTSVTIGNSVKSIGEEAFRDCPELLDVYCYAEKVPSTHSDAFNGSYQEYATLHVPDASIASYKAKSPWSKFGKIVGLSGGEPEQPEVPEVEKCATPVVTYAEGKLSFSCETEGAEFVTDITDSDIKKHYDAEIELSLAYNIEVYATKANCENSDTVNVALVWVENGNVDEDTGIISVPAAPVLIQGNGGILTVSGVAKDTEVTVYTISGTEVARATAADGTATISTGLQSGTIVVVKFGNKSVKVRI